MTNPNSEKIKFLLKFLAVIFAVAIVLGFFAFRNYHIFEKQMLSAQEDLYKKGANLNFEGCLTEVMEKFKSCSMTVLCAEGIPKLMGACLDPGQHLAECESSRAAFSDGHFGFRECVDRGATGKLKKVCGSAYRAFADYCKQKYFAQR